MSSPEYKATLQHLFEEIPQFHRIGKAAIKTDLTNIRRLCEALDLQDPSYQMIHVAGSNGKGSVCHILASLMQSHNLRIGLYTSPHYVDFRERIKVNGQPCEQAFVIDFMTRHQDVIMDIRPSFFEVTFAMALEWFENQQIDWAIIETGLGGRLDSTNVIQSDIQVITSISLEHTDYLGDTIEKIAWEKAGIIKPETTVILSDSIPPSAAAVIQERAISLQSQWHHTRDVIAPSTWVSHPDSSIYTTTLPNGAEKTIHTDLSGQFQHINLDTAIATYRLWLQQNDLLPRADLLETALSQVRSRTKFLGRWQWWSRTPDILMDGAHNPEALQYILDFLSAKKYQNTYLLLGFSEGKDIESFLEALPTYVKVIASQAQLPRAMKADTLGQKLELHHSKPWSIQCDVSEAWQLLQDHIQEEDILLVTGSIYLVGELMAYLEDS